MSSLIEPLISSASDGWDLDIPKTEGNKVIIKWNSASVKREDWKKGKFVLTKEATPNEHQKI